jgi:glycosyltransferase involved in cell wall biosynthesis
MRILLSAYACEPGKGSEPAVGWNLVRQIARFHQVWVITRVNNRGPIEKALAQEPLPNVRWVYFDLPRWARFWKKGRKGLHAYYYLWQIGTYRLANKLHRQVGFDLAHHVTIGASWYPTFLPLLPLPFVWGPVGAGLPSPKLFQREFSFRGKLSEWARQGLRVLSQLDPIRGLAEKRASMILAISPASVEQLKPANRRRAQLFSQVGINSKELVALGEKRGEGGNSFSLLSVGRLLCWKGFALGIKAFALFHKQFPNSEYWILGDGPERARLVRLVSSLGLSSAVRFLGHLSREDYFNRLVHCNVLVYPGLHEPGAFVIAEAMAARRPVICLDLGEPASIVTDETGIKIPASSPEEAVTGISQACARLAGNPALCEQMGDAGRKRILELFQWDVKGAAMAAIYNRVSTFSAAPLREDCCQVERLI